MNRGILSGVETFCHLFI